MVTQKNTPWNNQTEYYGLSGDSKPTGVRNGDKFVEINTGKTFLYNETGAAWVEQPASGGGGGSSDTSIANVTITWDAVSAQAASLTGPFCFEEGDLGEGIPAILWTEYDVSSLIEEGQPLELPVKCALYKGKTAVSVGYPEGATITTTGSITEMFEGIYMIGGDGTISIQDK